jgi:steroid delta-isomerase-like uncharacterized protein
MKKSILLWTKTTYVASFILLMLCLSFSCQQQVEEGITEEEVQNLVERDQKIWNEGNLALIDELIAPDYVEHTAGISEDIVGIDAFKERVTDLRNSFPDFNVTVEELIVKDDRIVWRWIATGTNTGTMNDIPPTGKKIRIEGVGILRVVDGKIVERLPYWNEATMLRQLGFTITPPQEPSEQ